MSNEPIADKDSAATTAPSEIGFMQNFVKAIDKHWRSF